MRGSPLIKNPLILSNCSCLSKEYKHDSSQKNNCQLILFLIPILNPTSTLTLTDSPVSGVGTIELSFFCVFIFSDNYKNRHTTRVLGLHTGFKFWGRRGGGESTVPGRRKLWKYWLWLSKRDNIHIWIRECKLYLNNALCPRTLGPRRSSLLRSPTRMYSQVPQKNLQFRQPLHGHAPTQANTCKDCESTDFRGIFGL